MDLNVSINIQLEITHPSTCSKSVFPSLAADLSKLCISPDAPVGNGLSLDTLYLLP